MSTQKPWLPTNVLVVVALVAFPAPWRSAMHPSLSATVAATTAQAPGGAPQAPPPPNVQTQPRQVTSFTLSPAEYRKARDYNRINYRLYFLGTIYGLAILLLILRTSTAPAFRNLAERASRNRFLQAVIFTPLFLGFLAILNLPLQIYDHHVNFAYAISVQSWSSWSRDWLKGELISFVPGILFVYILYEVLRRSPRRWWFYFWLATLPIVALLIFLQPLIVDPLFHKFEPLQTSHPEVVTALERVVGRAGLQIPPDRMFLMLASEKTNAIDAYVTGFGASKRVVVYDTTIAHMNPSQIAFVFGHEMGHYVLNHIYEGMLFAATLGFAVLWLASRFANAMLARWAASWGIRSLDDWAGLPMLLLLASLLMIPMTPIFSGFSRYMEHQADQYGLEVTHGLTPDSGQVAAQSFHILGEVDLSDPRPSRFVKFWIYDHPWIGDRIRFALEYHPWAEGRPTEWVK
jgi:STE24 endopeptidase